MKFDTWEDAENAWAKEDEWGGAMTDDVDHEESRFMKWMENNGHRVLEDDPMNEVIRDNCRNLFPLFVKEKYSN